MDKDEQKWTRRGERGLNRLAVVPVRERYLKDRVPQSRAVTHPAKNFLGHPQAAPLYLP
ncbi:MAG: hypothetical protein KME26_24300 [Oscillatoria princeps RMCB-10]|jgi:hypothetical protein|nr:hypothetical protein [Oscillatoria princeps RMCB-10]